MWISLGYQLLRRVGEADWEKKSKRIAIWFQSRKKNRQLLLTATKGNGAFCPVPMRDIAMATGQGQRGLAMVAMGCSSSSQGSWAED